MASTPDDDPSDRFPGLTVSDESDAGLAPDDTTDLAALAAFLLDRLGMAQTVELSILFVDAETIARLHQEWLDEPGPTDVISFPMDELREPAPGEPRVDGMLGDIVVCPTVAREQALAAGHPARHELRILVTHGLLHLLGHDHADEASERVMFARQEQLVRQYEAVLGKAALRQAPGSAAEDQGAGLAVRLGAPPARRQPSGGAQGPDGAEGADGAQGPGEVQERAAAGGVGGAQAQPEGAA